MKKLYWGASLLSLVLATEALAKDVYVRDISVQGLNRVENETVLAYVDIAKNSKVPEEKLNEALKQLYETGLFADVAFNVTPSGELVIHVIESPIINDRLFDGNKKVDTSTLETEVSLAPRMAFSKAKAQEDVQRILEVYKRTGRYAVVVEPKIINRENNSVDLIYEIDEGPVAAIEKINFIGNTHYSSSELQSEIMSKETRWYRIFSGSENFDAERMNYDKELLRRFYSKNGYADFNVVSAIAELSPDKKSFVLTFVVDEGPRYEIGAIDVVSDIQDVDTTALQEDVLLEVGDWYNADKIEKSVYAITESLGKHGFAFVDVQPELVRDPAEGKIMVTFHVKEGDRVFVNRININGNTRTDDDVIRREFRISEGDAFNGAKIRASRRNVENLDYFSKVDIQTQPNPDGNSADVNVNVEEKSTGYFNVGVGYSTVNGALIRTGITENNFMGRGQQLGFDIGVSQRAQDYNISFTEPYFLGRPLSAGIDLFRTEEDYQDEGSYDTESTGGRLRLGWNYTDDLSQYVRYTLREDQINHVDDDASIYIKEEEGRYTGSIIGQTIVYDKRDSAINPREGYYLSFGNDVAGLGGDEKYFKFDAKAYNYMTFADYYTWKIFANGGYITGYNGQDVRLANRYFLGGYNMRGFEYGGLGARDKFTNDALGGNWMVYTGTELSFPMGLEELGIRGRTFVDVGMIGKPNGVSSKYVDYSSTPRVATGVGLTWQSPMGNIDIDFAVPVVKKSYDETEVFRLNFGTRL